MPADPRMVMDNSFSSYLEDELKHAKEKLELPKPTELFLSDIHGEYEAFSHILKNACGDIRATIDELFEEVLPEEDCQEIATLTYYPAEKWATVQEENPNPTAWLSKKLCQMGVLYSYYAKSHTDFEVKSALTGQAYSVLDILIIDELNNAAAQQRATAIAESRIAEPATIALATAIQRLAVEQLHLVGDIYDRGPSPDLIMDELLRYPSVDIQWGNHDVVWMGAGLGQAGCIANVIRMCARYGNLDLLEEVYGIDLSALSNFALKVYKDDPCVAFGIKDSATITGEEKERCIKIQKAISIIQFKVEAQHIKDNPSFNLDDRNLLDMIDYEKGTILIEGKEYELKDKVFPTVDPSNPNKLTIKERKVVTALQQAFLNCQRLQRHMRLFLEVGSVYKISNNNLMFHACVPLNEDGSLKEVNIFGETYKGKELFDAVDTHVRNAYVSTDSVEKKRGADLLWYLWLGEGSPLFAKSKMTTFEQYLIADKATHKEEKNSFYKLCENEEVVNGIFENFGMDPEVSCIVCGHVPVKVKDGEDPVKCNGKVIFIDGGMSAAYQKTTGIAGFSLIHNSQGIKLATLEPLESREAAIKNNYDIIPTFRTIREAEETILVANTDSKEELLAEIAQLEAEISSYQC